MSSSDSPDRETGYPRARALGPVPDAAIDALTAAFTASAPGAIGIEGGLALLDRATAAAHARAFKLDVSFALAADGQPHARLSVNDKGEPAAFRDRLRAVLPALGVPSALLESCLALAPPGGVQTTASGKWEPGSSTPRVGLYFEELARHPDGPPLIDAAHQRFLGVAALPPPPGSLPVAVCIDIQDGAVRGAKDYHLVTEHEDTNHLALETNLESLRALLPYHPVNRTRRVLVARRHGTSGQRSGDKLLWMTEAWDPKTAAEIWATVDTLRAQWALPPSPTANALDALRASWPFPPGDAFLFPDLVGVNLDASGAMEALLLYVSVR